MNNKINKKQFPGIFRFFRKVFQIIIFITLQIFFIPFAVAGLIAGIYKEMVKSKRRGISFSAVKVLQFRWIMHYFDIRPDHLSVAFTKKFPCETHFGLWAAMGPLIISQRYFGFTTRLGKLAEPGKETLISTPGTRVLMFDRIIDKYVNEMDQIVIPGAGFDLIALHFTKEKNVSVFEIDQMRTLNIKIETLEKAGIQNDWIHYIPVDYSKDHWVDKLLAAGFDKTKKTLFLWQSVSLYLEPSIAQKTLCEMADLCSAGSIIAQDFYSKTFTSGDYSPIVKRQMRMIEKMGEPWKFGIDMTTDPRAAVDSFLRECGLTMKTYYQFGEKLDIEPFYCIVEAEKT